MRFTLVRIACGFVPCLLIVLLYLVPLFRNHPEIARDRAQTITYMAVLLGGVFGVGFALGHFLFGGSKTEAGPRE
ncbi:MAG: hypothetical protein JSS66_09040 [Armatimonadetes bacterium]|nr:hypothetical protein [Armatimonadota bacterium]